MMRLSNMALPEISVVLPIYNEEQSVNELYRRLTKTFTDLGITYELIFVDDGSTDDTYPSLVKLHQKDARLKVLKFSRNFGHHVAITAGMKESTGNYTVLMDSDLQDRPEDIPLLYAKIKEGYACVFGQRTERKDPLFKRFTSWLYLKLINSIVRLENPLNTNIFRIMSRQFVDHFNNLPERHRFVTGLMSWMGFKQVGVSVIHDKRYAGVTKYPLWKMLVLASNSVTSFTFRPLQLASIVGSATAFLSLVGIAILCYRKIVLGYGVLGWTSVMVTILFLGGVQLIALGLLGEYVGRSYDEQKKRPLYIIEKYHQNTNVEERTLGYAYRSHQSPLGQAS